MKILNMLGVNIKMNDEYRELVAYVFVASAMMFPVVFIYCIEQLRRCIFPTESEIWEKKEEKERREKIRKMVDDIRAHGGEVVDGRITFPTLKKRVEYFKSRRS